MAFCVKCGHEVAASDNYCEHCGTAMRATPRMAVRGDAAPEGSSAAQASEVVLLSFGPFGVTVCDGPYSMFRWQRKNTTVIEFTDRRIVVMSNRKAGFARLRPVLKDACFSIPYSSIVSARIYPHPARLGLMEVLEISHASDKGIAERSICSYRDFIQRAYAILESCRPPS